MKKFFFLLVLAVVLIGTFLRYLTVDGLPYPLGAELIPMVIIGASGFLALVGFMLSVSGAIHDEIMAWRRSGWRGRRPKRGSETTVTVLAAV